MEAELLQKCVDDYEKLIGEQISSANTVADLDTCHHKAKAKVLAALPKIWKEGSGPGIVSLKFVALVDKKLEESYANKKEHFEARKTKKEDANSGSSIRVEALELYKKQMNKYLSKHSMASPKELLMKHQDVSLSVTNFIREKFKDSIRSRTIIDLRMDMDGCHEYYQNRAKLNLSSLLDPALGIDLGTTNCCVMVYHKGEVQLIMNRVDGKRTTPSYVAFHPNDGTDTFGREAKESSYRNPELTIYDAKRMIGRSWSDENLQRDRKNWPFEIENDNDNPKIRTGNVSRYPHEVSARLLARFRNMAEEHFKLAPGTITKAVITVPAYFTEPQRRATEEAATCAGLQVLNILSEPSAAAIAYNYDKIRGNERKTVLIYDLGGGTFDVAIAEVRAHSVNVLGVDGDCHLGGQDFDQLIMEHCLKQFKSEHEIDIQAERDSSDRVIRNEARSALCRLKLQCELAKERLTTVKKTEVEVDKIFKGKNLSVVITRDLLEDLIKPLVAQTIDICKRAINEAIDKVDKTSLEIEEIILVGGATRMPLVEKMVTEYFPTNKICKSINPDEAVAYGAAIQAAIMNSAKDIKDIKIEDVIPLPIGVKTMTDTFTIVIPKNTKLPCEMKRVFATTSDNQMSTVVSVFQGEKLFCGENKWLGEFVFRGFLPRPAGEEKLQVTMTVNSNGILQVEAESVSTNRKNTITVKTERLGMDEKAIERVSNECAVLKLA